VVVQRDEEGVVPALEGTHGDVDRVRVFGRWTLLGEIQRERVWRFQLHTEGMEA
jgi:hypothetical protein